MALAIAYYRVSTSVQEQSGLGLEAQRHLVRTLCRDRGWQLAEEFTEVESGRKNDRPQLEKAVALARRTGAKLVVAKLDRLSRNAEFTLRLRNSALDVVCADNPDINRLTIGLLAIINEDERERISIRTREALAAARERGQKLGNPNGIAPIRRAQKGNTAAIAMVRKNADDFASDLIPTIEEIRSTTDTCLSALAKELNRRHILSPRGSIWRASSVRNLLKRQEALQSSRGVNIG